MGVEILCEFCFINIIDIQRPRLDLAGDLPNRINDLGTTAVTEGNVQQKPVMIGRHRLDYVDLSIHFIAEIRAPANHFDAHALTFYRRIGLKLFEFSGDEVHEVIDLFLGA